MGDIEDYYLELLKDHIAHGGDPNTPFEELEQAAIGGTDYNEEDIQYEEENYLKLKELSPGSIDSRALPTIKLLGLTEIYTTLVFPDRQFRYTRYWETKGYITKPLGTIEILFGAKASQNFYSYPLYIRKETKEERKRRKTLHIKQ